jgi:secreted Zn-dependent insulinase-like peptidase
MHAQLAGWASAPFVVEERQQRQAKEQAERERDKAEQENADRQQEATLQAQARKYAWEMQLRGKVINALDVVLRSYRAG